jgi:hypothetical protein
MSHVYHLEFSGLASLPDIFAAADDFSPEQQPLALPLPFSVPLIQPLYLS